MVVARVAHDRIFLTDRYNRRGGHLIEGRRRQFGKTPVNDRVNEARNERGDIKVRELWYGDPSRFNGMGPYEGLHRHLRRILNFNHDPELFASYQIWGDPQFKDVIRAGNTQKEEDYLDVPNHVVVYPSAGVAGALRMACPAIVLPPPGTRDEFLEEAVEILRKMQDEAKMISEGYKKMREEGKDIDWEKKTPSDILGDAYRDNPYLDPNDTLKEALSRVIKHFQGGGDERDNVVVPKWTYLSHSAEVAFAQGEVRTCELTRDGQVDLRSMFDVMDDNTQAVIVATVGNPLATAMPPGLFDEMVQEIHNKMAEYDHPIVLIADVIYEHFRRNRDERIDPIQRLLKMDIEVPIMETSSFSKMFGIAGYRLGFFRTLWKREGRFQEERHDLFTALETLYGTTLCPVPTILQKATGNLFVSIMSRYPVEEKLAPVAGVLTALKELTVMGGKGDTNTMMPDEVPEEILTRLSVDPKTWFTTSAVAKRTRKLANMELGKYNVDIETKEVERIGAKLEEGKLIYKRELEVKREKMMEILASAIINHAPVEHKLAIGLDRALAEKGVQLDEDVKTTIIARQISELHNVTIERADVVAGEVSELQMDFGIKGEREETDNRTVKLTLYKLSPSVDVPDLPRYPDGKIKLEGIAAESGWRDIARKAGVPSEDAEYIEHKQTKRNIAYERTDYFVRKIDEMAKKGLGVYLHPAYYNEYGELEPERINAFYVLFGFEKLRNNRCQAAELVNLCKRFNQALLGFTPGEVFLPLDQRTAEESFIRTVSLSPIDKDAAFCESGGVKVSLDKPDEYDMEDILKSIEVVANNTAAGEKFPYKPGGLPMESYKSRQAEASP